MPTSRKTTSAERGLPGSPMTGTPPQSASSVGLPGRSAIPWAQMPGSPSPATTAAVSSRAPTDEPAETTTTSHCGDRRRAATARERVAVVGDDPARVGLAAGVADERGQRRPRSRRGPGRSPSVRRRRRRRPRRRSRRSPRAGGRATRTSVTPAAASRPRSCARSGRPAGTSSAPGARVLVGAHQAVARRDAGRTTSIVPGIASWVCSTITTASAPAGSTPPVGIATRGPGATATSGARPIATAPVDLEVARQPLGRAVGVGRPHGVAVDGRAREARAGRAARATGSAGHAPVRVARARPSRPRVRRAGRKPASASATVRTAKNSRWVAG